MDKLPISYRIIELVPASNGGKRNGICLCSIGNDRGAGPNKVNKACMLLAMLSGPVNYFPIRETGRCRHTAPSLRPHVPRSAEG